MEEKQSYQISICPLCGAEPERYVVNTENLSFLHSCAKNGTLNEAVSLCRIIWNNIPELTFSADSGMLMEKLSKTILDDIRNQVNATIAPIQIFTESLPKIIDTLPENIRSDLLRKFNELQEIISKEFETLRSYTPTTKDLSEAVSIVADRLENITQKNIDQIKETLFAKLKETLEKTGFPEPQQVKLLAELVPLILPVLEELLRLQKIPSEKRKRGENELIQELQEYYPEDECHGLGASGDTDIIATPRFNGITLNQKVLIESKKNSSGWKRSFLEEVRRHMQVRGEHFAILAAEVVPKACNGFLIEQCPEGMILVTDRRYFCVSYGALRSALITLHPLHQREFDLHKLFADKRINEAIKDAYNYCEWVKRIREKSRRIETNAKGIVDDINQLDECLKHSLRQLQSRFDEVIKQTMATDHVQMKAERL
jgi:uncharacterized protein YoxC